MDMNTPDTEWESVEKIAEEVFKKIQKIDIDVANGLEHSLARETLKNVLKETLSSRDTYWKERVWSEYGKGFEDGLEAGHGIHSTNP